MTLFISSLFNFLLCFTLTGIFLWLAWVPYRAGLKYYACAIALTGISGNFLLTAIQVSPSLISDFTIGLCAVLIAVSYGLIYYCRKIMKRYKIGMFAESDDQQPGQGA